MLRNTMGVLNLYLVSALELLAKKSFSLVGHII